MAGIAAYAGDFNRVRDDALESGYRAKARHREDWLADYRMPERLAESSANYLGNAIEADTRSRAYDAYVGAGVDTARRSARESRINLEKVVAEQTLARLRGEATQRGAQTDAEIAEYLNAHVDPAEVAANPYLSEAVLGQRRQAGQQLLNLGTALGGELGDALASRGLAGLGHGLRAQRDAAGNLVWADAEGRRSAAYTEGARLPAAQAFAGNVDPLAQYLAQAEQRRQAPPQVAEFYAGDSVVQKVWNPQTGRYDDVAAYTGAPVAPTPYISDPASGTDFDALARAVMLQESGGNPNAVSPAGARGLMQLMPQTARAPGFGIEPARDASPQENLRVGRAYLAAMLDRYGGDQTLALAAYNAGPGRVDQALQAAGGDRQAVIAQLPAETRHYVQAVPRRVENAPASVPPAYATGTPLGVKRVAPAQSSALEQRLALAQQMGATPEELRAIVMGGSGRSQRISVDPATGQVSIEEGVPGGLAAPVVAQTQKDVQAAQDALAQLGRVGQSVSDQYLTYTGKAKAFTGRQLDKAGVDSPWTQFNADRGAALQEVEQFFNQYRKLITGAAAAEKELAALKEATIHGGLGPREFQRRYDGLVGSIRADIARKQRQLGAEATGGDAGGNAIPGGAVAALRRDPALAAQFDAKYGAGQAARVLGGR